VSGEGGSGVDVPKSWKRVYMKTGAKTEDPHQPSCLEYGFGLMLFVGKLT